MYWYAATWAGCAERGMLWNSGSGHGYRCNLWIKFVTQHVPNEKKKISSGPHNSNSPVEIIKIYQQINRVSTSHRRRKTTVSYVYTPHDNERYLEFIDVCAEN